MTAFFEKKKYSIEEYLTLERKSLEKLEYYNGNIFTMPGGTSTHNEICANIIFALKLAFKKKKKKYRLYTSDMKIRIDQENRIVYPDAVVVCEAPEHFEDRKDIILNPVFIVEVLSPSTEDYDRHLKFESYRTIPSFKEYMLVHQEKKFVSTFVREEENLWRTNDFGKKEKNISLKSIKCKIAMEDIYDGIEF